MTVSRATAREIGAELRRLRTEAGMTLRELERRSGHNNAKISQWENGHKLIPFERLNDLLEALDAPSADRERIIDMRRDGDGPGRLMAGPSTIGARLAELISQERAAVRITDVAPLLIPGLLQTADYARAILQRNPDVETRVALRMGRRDILTRTKDPVTFHALINDEVLVQHIGPPVVMEGQLRQLLHLAEKPNITIQIVPGANGGFTPMLDGPFILLEFPTATPTVHLEHYRASATLWDEKDVRQFTMAVEEIKEAAMTPDRTSEVIEELLHGMERT